MVVESVRASARMHKAEPYATLCSFLAGFASGARGRAGVLRSRVEIAVAGFAVGAMPLGEGLPHQAVDGGPILSDQLQPLPQALRRKVDPAEENARHEMTDLIRRSEEQ